VLTSTQVARRLHLSRDQIIVLIQQRRILARKSSDNRYLIPEVEVCRYQDVISLAREERSASEIDLIWVENACRILASRIQEVYPNVDVVISASLGGMIPAMLIYLSLLERRRGLAFLSGVTSADIIYAGTTVVVNDVLVTGQEFSFIKNLNTEVVASVVLHHVYQEGLTFEPDFRIDLVKEAPTYPWTVN